MWHAALATAVLLLLQLSPVAVLFQALPRHQCHPCLMHLPLPLSFPMCVCAPRCCSRSTCSSASLRLLLRIVKIFASSCRKLQKSAFSYVNFTQHAKLKLVWKGDQGQGRKGSVKEGLEYERGECDVEGRSVVWALSAWQPDKICGKEGSQMKFASSKHRGREREGEERDRVSD